MNSQDSDQPDTESRNGDASAEPVEAPKPRKRRSTKAAAAEAAVEVVEVAPAPVPVPEPEAAAPAKPKRTRRKTAADDAAQTVMFADEQASASPAAAEPTVASLDKSPVTESEAAVSIAGPAAELPAAPVAAKKRSAKAKAKPAEAPPELSASSATTADAAPAADLVSSGEPLAAAVPVLESAPAISEASVAEVKPVPPTGSTQFTAAAEESGGRAVVEVASQADADGTESPPTDGADADGPRRRNRNRRRGRRGNGDKAALGAPVDGDAEGRAPVSAVAAPVAAAASVDDDDDDEDTPVSAAPAPLPPVDAGETFADVLSGAYDAVPPEDIEAIPERRVLAAEPDAPKLHKVLAQAGIGSRRDMEQLIADGQVTVNGQPAHTGQRISFGDQIRIQGKPVKVRIAPPLPRVIAYHKPVGEVVTNDDPQHRPTVFRRLPRLPQGKWQSVGRLDINTEGLLLFTNSGEMANQLMHPRFGVEREYAVRVLGTLDQDGRDSLLEGVEIEGQRAAFKSIADGGGEGVNHWYRVVITEGRNREVRKLFDSVGLAVSRLIRIRYGCVVLPRGLKRGVYVDLNEAEVRELRRMAGGRDNRDGQGAPGGRPQQGQDGGGKSRRNRRGGQQGRGDRPDRPNDRGANDRPFERREPGEGGPIPNPLQQTFDKRAIREASRQPRREYSEDGPIPNPLEQTYDKRFVQKQRGLGGGGGRNRGGDQGGGGQPDPLKTAVGYIGADAFVRKFQGNGGGGGGGGGGGRGGRRRGGR